MGFKKSLSVRVQERAQRVLPAARNRAQVVALRHEIEQAITDGCSLAMIWNTLHEEQAIACGYETFRAHVRKLLRPHPEARPASHPATTTSRRLKDTTKPASSETEKHRGFVFNPIPNEEDLY
jgi:hypothetical protein